MATAKRIAANRANARLSTGPRTVIGKTRSSLNAVRHGLMANSAMLPGEDEQELKGLRDAMFQTLKPEGALENQIVERAASLIWRLRRFPAFEAALFEWTAYYVAQCYDDPVDAPPVEGRNAPIDAEPDYRADLTDRLRLGRVIEALLASDLTSKLSRYEKDIQRQLDATLKALNELQRTRKLEGAAVLTRISEPSNDADYGYFEHEGRRLKKIGPP